MKKDLKSMWTYARNYAIRKGFRNDAEDFAQEAVMKLHTGRRTSVENLFIDYIRSKFGRLKGKQLAKSREIQRYNQVDDNTHMNIEEGAEHLVSLAEELRGDEKTVFTLRFLWGFTALEIAYVMDITENAVSQRLGKIKRDLTESESR